MTAPAELAEPVPLLPRRSGRAGQRPAHALALGAAGLVAGGAWLGLHVANLHNGLLAVSCTAVGLVVLDRRPGHRAGRLFLATGVAHAVLFAGRQVGLHAADSPAAALPGAEWAAWLGVWPLPLVLVLVGVTVMSFPDGRLPSPRWRPAVLATAVAGVLLAVAGALWPVEYADDGLALAHPLDTPGAAAAQRVWDVAGPTCYLLFQALWVLCVVTRVRRATGVQATQLRWFVTAVVVSGAVMLLGLAVTSSPLPGVLAVPLVPVAAGLVIVTHRLYALDAVLTGTLVVGVMAGLVTGAYVALVAGAGRLIGTTRDGGLLPLLATALVAVAFEPVRRRVQRLATRLVHGDRPSPYEALARLPAQLGTGQADDELFTGLAGTVATAVGATGVTLWVGGAGELVAVASWPPTVPAPTLPRPLAALAAPGTHVRPVVHGGTLRGAVTVSTPHRGALTPAQDRLLADLVAQAGLLLDHVGLGAELQRRLAQVAAQAAELQAAARRIVTASDAARRRIERDLHDGAQQRLVTLALQLQAVARRAAGSGDAALAAEVRQAREGLAAGLAELRELARGIHPAVLTEEGLAAALGSLAERAPVPVTLDVRLDRRLPAEVEATAWFVVAEALTNAFRHAGASAVDVTARLEEGVLWVEVADDGRGGAADGGGPQALRDRVSTAGGRLTVTGPPGGGTRVRAEVPCAS